MKNLPFAQTMGKRESAPIRNRASRGEQGSFGVAVDPHFLKCDFDPYPRVPPGDYLLYCDAAQTYLDPGLKSWKCRYRFRDLGREDFPALFGFINLVKGEKRPRPRSRYYREWTIANGRAPAKRERMSSRAFKGKFFHVRVDWVLERRCDGKLHTTATRYSLVKEVIGLACSGAAELPSVEVHKPPSKDGSLDVVDSASLGT